MNTDNLKSQRRQKIKLHQLGILTVRLNKLLEEIREQNRAISIYERIACSKPL